MQRWFTISYGKEITAKIDEVNDTHISLRFPVCETPTLEDHLIVRDQDYNVEVSGDLIVGMLEPGLVQMKKEHFFENCKIIFVKDHYTVFEDYEDAINAYNDLLESQSTNTVSLAEVLDSSDYSVSNFRNIPKQENRFVEFKQTYALDIKKQKKADYLSEKVIQTIAAFMNARGGKIFIGISDDGSHLGMEEELAKFHAGNQDKFKRQVQGAVINALGSSAASKISYRFLVEQDISIFEIDVPQVETPIFYRNDTFYLRLDAANAELKGQDFYDFISSKKTDSGPLNDQIK